jgi:hypothetical protein
LAEGYARIDGSDLVDMDVRNILRTFFVSFIQDEPELILEKLHILAEIESRIFAPLLPRIMAEAYGTDWLKSKLDPLRSATKITNRYHRDEWTLHDSVCLLGKVDSETKDQSGLGCVGRHLGARWERTLRSAAELRNRAMHGKIAEPLKEWRDLLGLAVEVLPIYYEIRRLTDESGVAL